MSDNAYTHFRGEDINRVERVERYVVETILESCSRIPDEKRSWSRAFELKHSSSCTQVGRILAQKRGLRSDLGAIVCAMHDISVNYSGDAKDHASKGALIADEYLRSLNQFSEEEIQTITGAIREHSDKNIVSQNPYSELVKDADILDCSLYENTHDDYTIHKSPEVCRAYFDRVISLRKELGLPHDPQWDSTEIIGK